MFSANAERGRSVKALTIAGPAVLAAGLAAYAALQESLPATPVLALWFAALFVAGAGIGLAFPHLTVAAFRSVDDQEEAAKAAAGINMVFLIASAFSAALAGVLVSLGEPSMLDSARYLLIAFAAIAVVGVLPARPPAGCMTSPWRRTGSSCLRGGADPSHRRLVDRSSDDGGGRDQLARTRPLWPGWHTAASRGRSERPRSTPAWRGSQPPTLRQ